MDNTFQNIPFLRITIALAIGIIIGAKFSFDLIWSLTVLTIITALLIIVNFKYRYSLSSVYGLGIHLFFIFLGINIFHSFNKEPNFYKKGDFIAVALETPQEKENSYKSVIQVEGVKINDSIHPTKEFIIAYFSKDENATLLKAGDVILFSSTPQEINNFNNPYEFDYKTYLERKRIYRQVYLRAEQWHLTQITKKFITVKAENIREKLLQIYRSQPIDTTELEILSALTLGYKRDLDPETKRIFSASGASHVLAVSGLHVGIVFWVVSLLFGFLRKKKGGHVLFIITSLIILWFYTFITGLSPSVMRAASMFSIFVIGDNINRKPNTYNSLSASAFFLMLINPNNLFDVGFQLSYAAVFGIVFLQPKLEKQVMVKNKILKFFWSLITVSFAAQIATFPLTSFYFGQFPTYFWITNSFVIPAVMVLIPLGISLLFVSEIQIVAHILAVVLNTILKFTYLMLSKIEAFPYAVLEITVNQVQLILIVAMICSFLFFMKNQKVYFIKAALLFLLILSISNLLRDIKQLNQTEVIVYNTPKNQCIHLIHRKENYIITDQKIAKDEIYYHPAIKTIQMMGLKNPVFLNSTDSFKNDHLKMKNQLAFFEGKSFSFNKNWSDLNKNKLPGFILNPAIQFTDSIHIKTNTTIISNKRYFNENNWESDKIHYTSVKGAFRKNW